MVGGAAAVSASVSASGARDKVFAAFPGTARVSCLTVTVCAISGKGPGSCFCVNMGEEQAALPPSVQLGIDGRFSKTNKKLRLSQ